MDERERTPLDAPGPEACPFCRIVLAGDTEVATEGAASFPDRYPLSPGHTLVIPKRHVRGLFELEEDELAEVWALVGEVRRRIALERAPHGFNIGLNDGAAAGQTVPHAHVHVIPRYAGDRDDPRGGVRWVLPERAPYWEGAASGPPPGGRSPTLEGHGSTRGRSGPDR